MPEPDLHQLTKRTFHLIDSTYEFGLTQERKAGSVPSRGNPKAVLRFYSLMNQFASSTSVSMPFQRSAIRTVRLNAPKVFEARIQIGT